MSTMVDQILVEDGEYKGVQLANGELLKSKYLIAVPGKDGSEWLVSQVSKLRLQLATNPVDIGVRVELPAEVMERITDIIYESKLIYYTRSFDDRVRTFYMNPKILLSIAS